jgi:uncharacterized protein YcbK (DUF882 family)
MQLSPHFSLAEMTRTAHALPNDPSPEVVEHLTRLCLTLLEPVRTLLGVPLRVNSGFRSPAVNAAVHGSPTSQHMRGDAADLVPLGMSAEEAMARIAHEVEAGRLSALDQGIIYASGFLHLSTSATRPRQQLLRSAAMGGSGGPYTAYRS